MKIQFSQFLKQLILPHGHPVNKMSEISMYEKKEAYQLCSQLAELPQMEMGYGVSEKVCSTNLSFMCISHKIPK